MSRSTKRQVALLGGAFDPVTIGHLKVAQFVLGHLPEVIDEVWLTPCYGHRYGKKMASACDRLEMIMRAVKGEDNIWCFDYEITSQLSGSTYELIERLSQEKEMLKYYDFSIIIGLDNANTFHKWVEADKLIESVPFIVVPRKGVERDPKVDWYLNKPHRYLSQETEIPNISSTEIRAALREHPDKKPKNLNQSVFEYLSTFHLYER